MASLPAGAILDRVGPTRASILGAMLFGLGNLSFGSGNILWPVGETSCRDALEKVKRRSNVVLCAQLSMDTPLDSSS
jgi:hypothetical protein